MIKEDHATGKSINTKRHTCKTLTKKTDYSPKLIGMIKLKLKKSFTYQLAWSSSLA
jgi:hypothetical protein